MRLFVALFLLLLCLTPGLSLAQDAAPLPLRGAFSSNPFDGLDPKASLPNKQMDLIYKECRSTYPERFTPESLTYYCKCTNAALQAEMKAGEYAEISNPKNRNLQNETYAKYISKVVGPCLDQPIADSEYYSCVLNRSNDPRIASIPAYCKCVSSSVSQYFQKYGDAEAVIALGGTSGTKDPLKALWSSPTYKMISRQARDQCVSLHYKQIYKPGNKKGCD
jgi:hypothetical protein